MTTKAIDVYMTEVSTQNKKNKINLPLNFSVINISIKGTTFYP